MTRHFRCASCGKFNRVPEERLGSGPKCGACKTAIDVKNRPVHVTDAELDALVSSSPVPVLVDFYADWCGPCRSLAPVLEQLAERSAGQLVVAKVDTERDKRWAGQLGVSGIPAMFAFKDGQMVQQTKGAQPLGAIERWMAPLL